MLVTRLRVEDLEELQVDLPSVRAVWTEVVHPLLVHAPF